MKRTVGTAVMALAAFIAVPSIGRADIDVSTTNLQTMAHSYLYSWYLGNLSIPAGYAIGSATLTFHGLYEDLGGLNEIWLHLFDTAVNHSSNNWVASTSDNNSNIDSLASPLAGNALNLFASSTPNTYLTEWSGLPTGSGHATDESYSFGSAQLAALTTYIQNGGNIAFGIDPDCYFHDTSVEFKATFTQVPEPGVVSLLGAFGAALAALAGLQRAFRKRPSAGQPV